MKNLILTVGTVAIAACNIVGCAGDIGDESPDLGTSEQAMVYPNLKHTDNAQIIQAVRCGWSSVDNNNAAVIATTYVTSLNGALATTNEYVGCYAAGTPLGPTDVLLGDVTSTITQIGRTTCNESGTGNHVRMNNCSVVVSTSSFNAWCAGKSVAVKQSALRALYERQWGAALGLAIPADGTGPCTGTVMQSHTCGCQSMSNATGFSAQDKVNLYEVIQLDANSAEL